MAKNNAIVVIILVQKIDENESIPYLQKIKKQKKEIAIERKQ